MNLERFLNNNSDLKSAVNTFHNSTTGLGIPGYTPTPPPSARMQENSMQTKPKPLTKGIIGSWLSDDGKYMFEFMDDGNAKWGELSKNPVEGRYAIDEDILHLYPGEQGHFAISSWFEIVSDTMDFRDTETGVPTMSLQRVADIPCPANRR